MLFPFSRARSFQYVLRTFPRSGVPLVIVVRTFHAHFLMQRQAQINPPTSGSSSRLSEGLVEGRGRPSAPRRAATPVQECRSQRRKQLGKEGQLPGSRSRRVPFFRAVRPCCATSVQGTWRLHAAIPFLSHSQRRRLR